MRLPAFGLAATIQGQSWVVGAGCADRVTVRIRTGSFNGLVGTGTVNPKTAGFRLRFTPPRSGMPTGRATVVATQVCPTDQGGSVVRRARLTLVG